MQYKSVTYGKKVEKYKPKAQKVGVRAQVI